MYFTHPRRSICVDTHARMALKDSFHKKKIVTLVSYKGYSNLVQTIQNDVRAYMRE
jgi:hypothetical protein